MAREIVIGVIGSSTCSQEEAALAEEIGSRIADRGAVLVCGGMGGVMEAACRGARSRGGTTVGILPGIDRNSGNDHLDIAIPTGLGYSRNPLVVLSSTGVIAIGGAFGTLSEIAYTLIYGVPLVGIRTWELTQDRFPEGVTVAGTPEEAVGSIFEMIEKK